MGAPTEGYTLQNHQKQALLHVIHRQGRKKLTEQYSLKYRVNTEGSCTDCRRS